jgi:hypothetical protein
MPTYQIQKSYDPNGFLEVVNFLEKEFNSPSVGAHSGMINLILNELNNEQVTVFVQELYTAEEYMGSIIAFSDYIVFVKNSIPMFYTDVQLLFNVGMSGLTSFNPGEEVLYDNSDLLKTTPVKSLLITTQKLYGVDFYPITLKPVISNVQELASYIMAKVSNDGYVTSYCVNLKSLNQIFITIANNRSTLLSVDIPINATTIRRVKLTFLGDTALVPNTPESRAFIDSLKLQGLIYEIS